MFQTALAAHRTRPGRRRTPVSGLTSGKPRAPGSTSGDTLTASFGTLGELVHADDLAVAERVDVVEAGSDLNAASATVPSQADRRDHAVAPCPRTPRAPACSPPIRPSNAPSSPERHRALASVTPQSGSKRCRDRRTSGPRRRRRPRTFERSPRSRATSVAEYPASDRRGSCACEGRPCQRVR
jgi:hypothetical protein